jgi:hypothetical protein
MDYVDIYKHVTEPEKVFLLEQDGGIVAMGSYNSLLLSGIPSLIVEGITIDQLFQGKDIFRDMTNCARNCEQVIGLRTQSPRMYRALEKYCSEIYPGSRDTPKAICAIRDALAEHMSCKIDEQGIVRKYYGGLFYGEEPTHPHHSAFFKERLGMDLYQGDGLLVIGVKNGK